MFIDGKVTTFFQFFAKKFGDFNIFAYFCSVNII